MARTLYRYVVGSRQGAVVSSTLPLPTTMSPTSSLSTRGLIPGLPATITVVHLDARACDVIQNALNLNDTNILGVSLRLSKHGAVEAVALATPTTVFLISIGKTNTSSKPGFSQSGVDLARVLANPCVLLAGLNVARIALLLHRQTGADVYGVELTSLPVKPAVKHVSAADLAGTYINHNTPKRPIHALWLHDGNLDLCLKAWILVRYVSINASLRCMGGIWAELVRGLHRSNTRFAAGSTPRGCTRLC